MATKGELDRWISRANYTITQYNNTISECDDKIKRLNKVYKELSQIKKNYRAARKNTKKDFSEKGEWRGDKHTSFCNSGDMLDQAYGDYYTQQLDAAHDAINKEIGELTAKKRELIPLIGGLLGDIARWRADLKNIGN